MPDIYAGLGLRSRDEQLAFLDQLMREGEMTKLPGVPFDSFTPTARRREEAMENIPPHGPRGRSFNARTGQWEPSQYEAYVSDMQAKRKRKQEHGY